MKFNFKLTKQNYILYLVIIVVIAVIILYLIPKYICYLIKQDILQEEAIESALSVREGFKDGTDGLQWTVYNGYFNDDIYFPQKYTKKQSGSGATDLSSLNKITNNYLQESRESNRWCDGPYHMFSIELLGFFVPNVSGSWYFRTSSDDASYLWIGPNASDSNYKISNAAVVNQGIHGRATATAPVPIELEKNKAYPIRIQMGEWCGDYNLTVEWKPPGGNWSSSGIGLLYNTSPPKTNNMLATYDSSPGLKFVIYNSYFGSSGLENVYIGGDTNTSPIYSGTTSNLSSLSKITNNFIIENATISPDNNFNDLNSLRITSNNVPQGKELHNFTIELTGLFKPNVSGNWEFFTYSDDASYLWIGDEAVNNWNINNATINNGRTHGMQSVTGAKTLEANNYYPIRIIYGEQGGVYNLMVGFRPPGGTWTSNGTNYFFTSVGKDERNFISHKYGIVSAIKR